MFAVRKAETVDYPYIKQFIEQSEALYDEGSVFILVENEHGEMLSVIGLQLREGSGFLRSFVFSPAFPAEKLALFFEKVLQTVKESGCRSLYLASNKRQTVSFFELFDFQEIGLEEIPESIKLSTDFIVISESKGVFYMWKTL